MRHHPVKSSRIASIGYDERTNTLEVRFNDKSALQYHGVPEEFSPYF
jgi:hypothetical protein